MSLTQKEIMFNENIILTDGFSESAKSSAISALLEDSIKTQDTTLVTSKMLVPRLDTIQVINKWTSLVLLNEVNLSSEYIKYYVDTVAEFFDDRLKIFKSYEKKIEYIEKCFSINIYNVIDFLERIPDKKYNANVRSLLGVLKRMNIQEPPALPMNAKDLWLEKIQCPDCNFNFSTLVDEFVSLPKKERTPFIDWYKSIISSVDGGKQLFYMNVEKHYKSKSREAYLDIFDYLIKQSKQFEGSNLSNVLNGPKFSLFPIMDEKTFYGMSLSECFPEVIWDGKQFICKPIKNVLEYNIVTALYIVLDKIKDFKIIKAMHAMKAIVEFYKTLIIDEESLMTMLTLFEDFYFPYSEVDSNMPKSIEMVFKCKGKFNSLSLDEIKLMAKDYKLFNGIHIEGTPYGARNVHLLYYKNIIPAHCQELINSTQSLEELKALMDIIDYKTPKMVEIIFERLKEFSEEIESIYLLTSDADDDIGFIMMAHELKIDINENTKPVLKKMAVCNLFFKELYIPQSR